MFRISKSAVSVIALISVNVGAQSFTNCIPYVAGRPDQGMNCSTTTYGNGGGMPLYTDPGTAFSNGYNAASQVGRDAQQNNMINRARQDCNNGVARACEYLKQNNVY